MPRSDALRLDDRRRQASITGVDGVGAGDTGIMDLIVTSNGFKSGTGRPRPLARKGAAAAQQRGEHQKCRNAAANIRIIGADDPPGGAGALVRGGNVSPEALLAAGRAVEARFVHPTGILGTELRARVIREDQAVAHVARVGFIGVLAAPIEVGSDIRPNATGLHGADNTQNHQPNRSNGAISPAYLNAKTRICVTDHVQRAACASIRR